MNEFSLDIKIKDFQNLLEKNNFPKSTITDSINFIKRICNEHQLKSLDEFTPDLFDDYEVDIQKYSPLNYLLTKFGFLKLQNAINAVYNESDIKNAFSEFELSNNENSKSEIQILNKSKNFHQRKNNDSSLDRIIKELSKFVPLKDEYKEPLTLLNKYRNYLETTLPEKYHFNHNAFTSAIYFCAKALEEILYTEKLSSLESLADKIDIIVPKYSLGGEKAQLGFNDDCAWIRGLKSFQNFVHKEMEATI